MLVTQENVSLDHDEEASASIPADRLRIVNNCLVNANFHPCPTVDRRKRELADQSGVETHHHDPDDADVKVVST
jgi:hypothetical protein